MANSLLLESGSFLLLESSSKLLLESAPLDLTGWLYSRALTDTAGTSLSGYVCSLSLTSSNFNFSLAKPDGSDLRVVDVTSATFVPLWLLDYDPIAQTATVYYKAALTSHLHRLYYGNAAASAVSNFALVFLHGTGFDADWGDLATASAGAGAATRYAGPTSTSDKRNYLFWRLQESPMLQISDLNSAGVPNPSGVYTGLREFNLIRDGSNGRVLKIGSLYYATFSRRPNTNAYTIDDWMATSTSKYGPWSNFTQPYATGTEHLNYPSSVLKIGSTYYMFITFGWTNGGGITPGLVVKLRTSTDLATWTDQGTVVAPGIFNDQSSGPCTNIGNPWVTPLADGTYMLVVEGYGGSGVWGCYGAISPGPPFTTWTALNSGNALVGSGAAGTWDLSGAANPKCHQMPDGSFVIQFNGSDFPGPGAPGSTNSDWEHGYATASSAGGPYTVLTESPVVGRPELPSPSYGFETAHFSWDEDGKSYYNVGQRFQTDSSTAQFFLLYAEPKQGGLLLTRDPAAQTDAAHAGRLMDAGSWTAESRSVILAHRAYNGTPILLGLMNASSLPAADIGANFASIRVIEIQRNTHDRANPGDVYLTYRDGGGTVNYWSGSAWTTASTSLPADYAREVVARIQDDGAGNYILSANYADDGSTIAGPASIAQSSVRPMPLGRFLIVGDPFTNSWTQTLFLRSVMVRPYAATEPAMVFTAPPTAYQSLILSEPSLLNYWQLQETAGTVAVDSLSGNNGTYANCALNQSAPVPLGVSASFNGTNSIITVPTESIPGPLSIEFWFKVATADSGQGGMAILKKPINAQWEVLFFSGQAFLRGSSSSGGVLVAVPTDGLWHHYVGTQTATTGAAYLDGVNVGSGSLGSALANGTTPGTNDLAIGNDGSNSYPFKGNLCHVALYNTVLTPTQVHNHYTVGTGGSLGGVPLPLFFNKVV